jgi:hypothetical protein
VLFQGEKRIVSQLLTLMDGLKSRAHVIVMGAARTTVVALLVMMSLKAPNDTSAPSCVNSASGAATAGWTLATLVMASHLKRERQAR